MGRGYSRIGISDDKTAAMLLVAQLTFTHHVNDVSRLEKNNVLACCSAAKDL